MSHADVPPEVRQLEALLDSEWRNLRAFRLPEFILVRSLFIQVSKAISDLGVAYANQTIPHQVFHDRIRRIQGGFRWCMIWANVADREIDPMLRVEPKEVEMAIQLGAMYDDVNDMMVSCGHGLAVVRLLQDGRTARFDYVDDTQSKRAFAAYMETLEQPIASSEGHMDSLVSSAIRVVEAVGWLGALQSEELRALASRLGHGVTMLPQDWQVARYSLEQANHAWSLLRALGIVDLHLIAHGATHATNGYWETTSRDLMRSLRSVFGGSANAAMEWIDDITTSDWSGRAKVDINLAPWVEVRGKLLTSGALLSHLSHERNLTKIWSTRQNRRKAWESLKNCKEAYFRDELKPLAQELGWQIGTSFKYRTEGRTYDCDAVLLDSQGGLAVLELKWPIPADSVHEVMDDQEEFAKGQQQVARTIKWCKEHPQELAAKGGVLRSHAHGHPIVGLVVSRTTVPVIRDQTESIVTTTMSRVVAALGTAGLTSVTDLMLRSTLDGREVDESYQDRQVRGHTMLSVGATRWMVPAVAVGDSG